MASKNSEAMQVAEFLHMNGGNDESSYVNNSSVQETGIRKVQPILKETIKCIANVDGFPQCFRIADFGCSSGPNTLLVVSNIIDEVYEACSEKNLKVPQFQVSLNDLVGNDFNSIFKLLPMFYAKHEKEKEGNFSPCYVSAVPGSFHGRLFPDNSMHFFHSSSSLYWLSQVPEGLEDNKINIYMAKTSPPKVFEKYRMQFEKDFTTFLDARSIEMIRVGRMVLAFLGRSDVDPISCNDCISHWGLLAKSLVDLVNEGLVRESDVNLFNIPLYNPYKDEVKDLIRNQGSFSLDVLDSAEINWDPYDPADYENMKLSADQPIHGERVAKILRAVAEPMLVTHFGSSAMDLLFQKYANYVDEHLSTNKESTLD